MLSIFRCFLIIIALLITHSLNANAEDNEVKVVEVDKVGLSNITQTVRLIGTIKAKRSTVFVAKTQGTLYHQILAGKRVSKGTVIARLENTELEKSYALSMDALNIAKAQYERLLPLSKSHVISKQTLDEKRTEWIEAQKKLSLAKIELDKSQFIAPFNGIVGVYKITQGSQVQEGDVLVTFYDPSDVMVEFDIPGALLSRLKDGQHVTINEKSFSISHVQKIIDPETYMSTAYVHFNCPNCFIGETIDVDLSIAEHRNVIVVPHDAVFLKNGKPFVYLVVDHKAILQPVILGLREKNNVEILQGIDKGDELIIRGHARLYPDVAVKIHDSSLLAKKAS